MKKYNFNGLSITYLILGIVFIALSFPAQSLVFGGLSILWFGLSIKYGLTPPLETTTNTKSR